MRALLAAALVAFLAGCAEPTTEPLGPTAGETAGAAPVPAPTLRLGDWWALTPSAGAPFKVVVAAEQGPDWVFATDDPGTAFFDARYGDISYLGPQRKADLAGSQGSDRVQFFAFPLEDNKTWTTTWDGQQVTVRAMRDGDLFHMAASNATGPYASYTYDPALRWFSRLEFLAPDGSAGYTVKVDQAGGNFTGDLAGWTFQEVVRVQGDLASEPFTSSTFQVPAGVTDVHVDVAIHCTAGFVGGGTAPAPFVGSLAGTDERGAGTPGEPCPLDLGFQGVAGDVRPDATGSETWGYSAGGAGATGTIDLTILLRTYTPQPFGTPA